MYKEYNLPKLSVIIPVYNNSRKDIFRCLSHIDNQQYDNIEVLIIDDGSATPCKCMLDELSAQFSFCRVIHQENRGVSAARNKGISLATGEFITFLDGDDAFSEHFLIDLKTIFLKYDSTSIDVVYGYTQRVYDIPTLSKINPITHSNIRLVSDIDKKILMCDFIQDCTSTYRNENGYLGCVSVGRVVKASIMKKIKFNENLSHNEDNIWNLDLLGNIKKVIIIDRCWYYYIYNPNSVTHIYNLSILSAYENYLNYLWRFYIDNHTKSVYYLRLTIHLALTLKARNYKYNKKMELNISKLFKRNPWKNGANWDCFLSLSSKDKILFILIKLGLIDTTYKFNLYIKNKLKFRALKIRDSDW